MSEQHLRCLKCGPWRWAGRSFRPARLRVLCPDGRILLARRTRLRWATPAGTRPVRLDDLPHAVVDWLAARLRVPIEQLYDALRKQGR